VVADQQRATAQEVADWTVRYTWLVPDGSAHAPYTFVPHESESSAVDDAVATLDRQAPDAALRVVRAAVMLPGGAWREVE
jgi:hypothetical protein